MDDNYGFVAIFLFAGQMRWVWRLQGFQAGLPEKTCIL